MDCNSSIQSWISLDIQAACRFSLLKEDPNEYPCTYICILVCYFLKDKVLRMELLGIFLFFKHLLNISKLYARMCTDLHVQQQCLSESFPLGAREAPFKILCIIFALELPTRTHSFPDCSLQKKLCTTRVHQTKKDGQAAINWRNS